MLEEANEAVSPFRMALAVVRAPKPRKLPEVEASYMTRCVMFEPPAQSAVAVVNVLVAAREVEPDEAAEKSVLVVATRAYEPVEGSVTPVPAAAGVVELRPRYTVGGV